MFDPSSLEEPSPFPVAQLVIPVAFVDVVLQLLHDAPSSGHPGRDRTLAAARRKYYLPTMRIDIEKHVSCCLSCAQTKGTTTTAPILEYPLPAGPFYVVGLDLLQLPRSSQGSGYIIVCIDHFSRFVVLAPLRDKSAATVAHALVSHLICPYTTPRVLFTDNGTESKNQVLADIVLSMDLSKLSIRLITLLLTVLLNVRIGRFLRSCGTFPVACMRPGRIGFPRLLLV